MIALESDRMRVELDPAFGARVTALWDKRVGREWLVTGPREEGDGYGAAQARGWDECFPIVAPCGHWAWGPLRDHGLLWGRPWRVQAHVATARTILEDKRFAFTRTLDLQGGTLHALYELASLSDTPLPWIWSQHYLLAARPGERVEVEGASGWTDGTHEASWPLGKDGRDLSRVERPEAGWARKLYARVAGRARLAVTGGEGSLAFEWDEASASAPGLWLCWGGWPADPAPGAPVHQFALEPATALVPDLAGAEVLGAARILAPGTRASWRAAVKLTDPA